MTPTMLVDGEGRSYVRYDEWMSTDAQLAEALRQGDCLRRDLAEAKRHLRIVLGHYTEHHDWTPGHAASGRTTCPQCRNLDAAQAWLDAHR